MNTLKVVFIGEDWEECTAFEDVTAKMAALAVMPFHTGGYGRKNYPTCWKVFYKGRNRRIYSTCYSNAARLHVVVNGKQVSVR